MYPSLCNDVAYMWRQCSPAISSSDIVFFFISWLTSVFIIIDDANIFDTTARCAVVWCDNSPMWRQFSSGSTARTRPRNTTRLPERRRQPFGRVSSPASLDWYRFGGRRTNSDILWRGGSVMRQVWPSPVCRGRWQMSWNGRWTTMLACAPTCERACHDILYSTGSTIYAMRANVYSSLKGMEDDMRRVGYAYDYLNEDTSWQW